MKGTMSAAKAERKKMQLTTHEKEILKINLRQYLLSVLEEEEYCSTLAKCREAVRRTQGGLLARGRSLASCASDWLRGLPIGVEFATWPICVKMFELLGWKYDPLCSLGEINVVDNGGRITVDDNGRISVVDNGRRKTFDTYDLDCLYWRLLGEIIAEGRSKGTQQKQRGCKELKGADML